MANPYHGGFDQGYTGLSEGRDPFGPSSKGNPTAKPKGKISQQAGKSGSSFHSS